MLEEMNDTKQAAILFSGGRDSSLAVCLLALQGYEVHLLSFNSGVGIRSDLSTYRYEELKERFPNKVIDRVVIPTFGIFRRIAIMNIEKDFAEFKVNLILVGEKMAMHAAAIVYCLQNKISLLADGCSGYQAHMPEQMPVAVNMLKAFHEEYGVEYITPIQQFSGVRQVRYTLMEIGVSPKSIEGSSIFASSFTRPTPEVLRSYMEQKMPICREYIELMLSGNISDINLRYSP